VAQPQEFRLGELLIARQAITASQLDHALDIQRATGQQLGEILVEQRLISGSERRSALNDQARFRAMALAMLLAAGSALLPANSARATSQGSLGSSSTASSTISVIIPSRVQISRFDDIVVPIASRSRDAAVIEPICVRGIGSSTYRVIASGTGPGSSFALANGSNEILPYQVSYRGDLGAGGSVMLSPGSLSGSFPVLSREPNCNGSDTSAVEISIAAGDIASLPGGSYSGSLTITVSAE
jgi:hypothetical protein